MSTTPYESPENAADQISVDITHTTVWFFQHTVKHEEVDHCFVTMALAELPAIVAALTDYLGDETEQATHDASVRDAALREAADRFLSEGWPGYTWTREAVAKELLALRGADRESEG